VGELEGSQGHSTRPRWPRKSPHIVLTHMAVAPKRERCAGLRSAFQQESTARFRRPGQPGRSVTRRKASRWFAAAPRKGSVEGYLGHAGERKARIARCTPSQLPAGSGTGEAVPAAATRGVRDRRRHEVKAAPAQEARAVRHEKHREVLVPEALGRGLCSRMRKQRPQSRESRGGRSKLAGANS